MSRVVIVGGGVIGLSLAYELSGRGADVVALERDAFARKASWAGAGILLPVCLKTSIHPFDQLEAFSTELHQTWSGQLLSETGIDNGFAKCGGLYIARSAGEVALLAGSYEYWRQREIPFDVLSRQNVVQRFPVLQSAVERSKMFQATFVPGEYQIRNPDHNRALLAACRQRGVKLIQQVDVALLCDRQRVLSVQAGDQTMAADQFCFCAGPWTAELVAGLGVELPMQPVRGHMVLYKLPQRMFSSVINEGSRYLVPRADGHVLAGSTIEEVGFDESIDEQEVTGLKAWAASVLPNLNDSCVAKVWTGLRPGTYDGFPYLGRLPGFENAFVSTGHFKAGLHTSTGSAVVMADLLLGRKPTIDLTPFAVSRVNDRFHRKSIENS